MARSSPTPDKAKAKAKAKPKKGKRSFARPMGELQSEELKAAIRVEYETTEVSLRALCLRYNLKSDATIRRWAIKEGWVRDLDVIRGNVVGEAVRGTSLEPESGPDVRTVRKARTPKTASDNKEDAETRTQDQVGAHKEGEENEDYAQSDITAECASEGEGGAARRAHIPPYVSRA